MKQNIYYAFFTMIVLSISGTLQAQIGKGTGLLGGSIHFSSGKSENPNSNYLNKSSSFSLTPAYGKFIKQNLVVGGDLSYGGGKVKLHNPASPEQTQKNNVYGLGVFARQYKNLGASGFYLFLQGRLWGDVSRGKTEYSSTYDNIETKGYNIGLNLSPGISYALSPGFHIETGLNNLLYTGYSASKSKQTPGGAGSVTKYNGFSAGASVGGAAEWTIGFRVLLAK